MTSSQKRTVLSILLISVVATVAVAGLWRAYVEAKPEDNGSLPVFGEVGEFSFTNFDGRKISRDDLRGKILVVNFVFTTCGGLCPQMSGMMETVQRDTAKDPALAADSMRLVTISTDPQVDTIERLRAYAEQHGADPRRWHFLRGDFATVQKFSQDALKLGLERASPEQIEAGSEKVIHSNKFVLIDRLGRIRGHYSGTVPSEVRQLIRDLPKLANEASPASRQGE